MNAFVTYRGRCGNTLFKYCSARLFAEKHNGVLHSPLPDACVVRSKWHESYAPPPTGAIKLTDKHDIMTMPVDDNADYLLDGWFQRTRYYMPRRDEIRTWFDLADVDRNERDIVMHVRLGDYYTNWADGSRVIHPQWYCDILDAAYFGCVYIVTAHPNDPYLNHFDKYHPTVISGDELDDFDFLRRFSRVIVGNSTFSWWAWFLGHGERCCTFKPWVKDPQIELAEFAGAVASNGDFYAA